MVHSVGLWVVLAILAFSFLWFLVIRAYARRQGADLGRGGLTSHGSRDAMYNPDPGSSQRGSDGGQPRHHDHGGGSHFGGGWSGGHGGGHHGSGGGDSGGGHHH